MSIKFSCDMQAEKRARYHPPRIDEQVPKSDATKSPFEKMLETMGAVPVKGSKESMALRSDLRNLTGDAARAWCMHAYRLKELGLPPSVDDIRMIWARVLSADAKFLVFFDMDETITKSNYPPSDAEHGVKEPRGDEQVIEYITRRVPLDLQGRMKHFFDAISKRSDIEFFMLTDNQYWPTKCTVKLAFDFDLPPGTIIDRTIRQKKDAVGSTAEYESKGEFIERCLQARNCLRLPPTRVLFADNLKEHRDAVSKALKDLQYWEKFVCCNNLVTGFDDQHMIEIRKFLKLPADTGTRAEGGKEVASSSTSSTTAAASSTSASHTHPLRPLTVKPSNTDPKSVVVGTKLPVPTGVCVDPRSVRPLISYQAAEVPKGSEKMPPV